MKLQGQPFEVLVALLDRRGEVISRDELKQKIWPSESVGDFDQGLNRAINKIREALDDSATSPQFVETLSRRGYRFVGLVQEENDTKPAADAPQATSTLIPASDHAKEDQKRISVRKDWLTVGAIGTLTLLLAGNFYFRHSSKLTDKDSTAASIQTNPIPMSVREWGSATVEP